MPNDERKRFIEFYDVLIVGAEAPDALDEHLQRMPDFACEGVLEAYIHFNGSWLYLLFLDLLR